MAGLMRENGTVVAVQGEQVRVSLKRHASCASCGACGLGGQTEMTLLINNTLRAKVGDRVVLELPTNRLYQAAFLVYTLPLLMLLLGFWAGQAVGRWLGLSAFQIELGGIVSGFGLMTLTFWAIHCWDQKRQIGVRYQPHLVQIIPFEE